MGNTDMLLGSVDESDEQMMHYREGPVTGQVLAYMCQAASARRRQVKFNHVECTHALAPELVRRKIAHATSIWQSPDHFLWIILEFTVWYPMSLLRPQLPAKLVWDAHDTRPRPPWAQSQLNGPSVLPEDLRGSIEAVYEFAQPVELSPAYPYCPARMARTLTGKTLSHPYYLGWLQVTASRPPDARLAQIGNVWIQASEATMSVSVCIEEGKWQEWLGTSTSLSPLAHPYAPRNVFYFYKKFRWMATDGVRGRKTDWQDAVGMTAEQVSSIVAIVPPLLNGKLCPEMTASQCVRVYRAAFVRAPAPLEGGRRPAKRRRCMPNPVIMTPSQVGSSKRRRVELSQMAEESPGESESRHTESDDATNIFGSNVLDDVLPQRCPTEYDSWPSDVMLAGREGVEWPADCPKVQWWNGLRTILPFMRASNGRKIDDQFAVEKMAKNPGAWGNPRAPVVYVKLPPERPRLDGGLMKGGPVDELRDEVDECLNRIRVALKKGFSVVVYPYRKTPADEFNEAGIERLCGPLSQVLEWQDAHKRQEWRESSAEETIGSFPNIAQRSTLGEFVAKADDPDTCGNLLDLPIFSPGEVPWFISAISDDRFSWSMTKDRGYSAVNNHTGPQDMTHDVWRMLNWILLTMGGFVTYPHHDAEGLATYVGVRDGAKIWTIYAPQEDNMTREEWLTYQTRMMSSGDRDFAYLDHAEGYNILLTADQYLIMPPGTWHAVYTPVKTVAVGGHFLTMDMLAQTELARTFDLEHGSVSTNTSHDGIERTLCRMALSLCERGPINLPRGSFVGLASMVLRAGSYRRKTAAIRKTKEVADELEDAKRVIKKVMQANAILESDIEEDLVAITWGGELTDDRQVNIACVQGYLRGDQPV